MTWLELGCIFRSRMPKPQTQRPAGAMDGPPFFSKRSTFLKLSVGSRLEG